MSINSIVQDDIEKFAGRSIDDDPRAGQLDYYQWIATKSAIYPGQGTPIGLIYCALKLNGEAGELAEHVGKAMRDDNLVTVGGNYSEITRAVRFNVITPERRKAIIKEGGDVLWYLSAICNELGISLSELAEENLIKLADRAERNKLRGSGDER